MLLGKRGERERSGCSRDAPLNFSQDLNELIVRSEKEMKRLPILTTY